MSENDEKRMINIEISSVENIASVLLVAAEKISKATKEVDELKITKELIKFNQQIHDIGKMNIQTFSLDLSLEIKKAFHSIDFETIRDQIFAETTRELKKVNGTAHISCQKIGEADEKLSKLASSLSEKIDEVNENISELAEIERIVTSLRNVETLQQNYSVKNTIVSSILALAVGAGGMFIFLKYIGG